MHTKIPGATSGMFDNLSASRAKYTQHVSHHILQGELCERVVYNDQDVMKTLRIMDVPSSFVKSCAAELNKELAEDVEKLKEIQRKADNIPLADLEVESSKARYAADPDGRIPVVKITRERDMYPPLQRIFDCIQNFSSDAVTGERQTSPRRFQIESSPLLPNEDQTVGFPRWTPDFSLVHDATMKSGKQWRLRDGFVEVKPSSNQHLYPGDSNPRAGPVAERALIYDSGSAKPLITQVGNYSRLHLSARAFAIQSVGLMIFGCDFCVSIFNHANGRVSPCYNMWEDIDVFIRVVRSMTHILTDYELWQDRSTEWVPSPERIRGLSADSQEAEDTYIIQPIGGDDRKWCTVGSNIWSSPSLFGRGTTIWPVRVYRDDSRQVEGEIMILKTALRSGRRQPEFSIYQQIKRKLKEGEEWPRGLAELVLGGDVSLNGQTQFPIDFPMKLGTGVSSAPRAILNRIITAPMGRRIWDYTSESELIKGLICALEAHQWLCEKGWLHRDISAGNILLAMKPNDSGQAPGFLIDLEYARTLSDEPVVTERDVPPQKIPGRGSFGHPVYTNREKIIHTHFDGPPRGAPITGTLHFLSRRQLSMVINPNLNLKPTPEDDVESFFLVLIYAVIRSLACSEQHTKRGVDGLDLDAVQDSRGHLLQFFEQHWGAKTVQEVYQSRVEGAFFVPLFVDDPVLSAGNVGTWFMPAGGVSDALFNNVLSPNIRKFRYDEFVMRPRKRAEGMLNPDSHQKPPPSFLTTDKLFAHDELIQQLKAALPAWEKEMTLFKEIEAQKAKERTNTDL